MTGPITTHSGTFTYSLGADFAQKHVADDLQDAQRKARNLYDPWHADPHRAAVTVIIRATLTQATQAVDSRAKSGYDWSVQIDNVQAVMMGPSDRAGVDGDPGQLDNNVTSVVVSGYNAGNNTRKITHVAASQ
jgi:hypothetical protein